MKKTLFLVLFALLGLASAWAYDFGAVAPTGQTLYYTITSSSSHTVSVVPPNLTGWSSSFTKPTGSLTIPSTVTYGGTAYSVTSIGSYAFNNCSGLTSVTIPNSVTAIGDDAFESCSGLTSVTIPNSVTSIGDLAFGYCSGLTSVTIPNSVTSIGSYAFDQCSRLTHVAFNARNCNNGTFSGCTNIRTFTFGDSVQRIPAWLCCGLAITSITIPNSVTSIGSHAFDGCSGLTGSLTIPNSVTSIGGYAFAGCSGLTGSLTIPNSVTSIGGSAFEGCSGLTGSLTIPNSVTSIGDRAFYRCSGLTGRLTIPNSVTSIGSSAFDGCSGLTGSLTIPNSVTSIGSYAFYGCSGLTGSLTIPNSVTSIGIYAFRNCTSLNHVTFNVQNCEDFGYYSSSDPRLPFTGCTNISTFTLGDSVQRIPAYLCYGLAITSITIPNSVTSIGSHAFDGCSGLTGSLTIPNSVTSIGG
ncbi:MAG: leucine-rich repeat domain-containing protein, partial [Bacteroidales bacterium]|nr:leucine-rich repeat domain-containing protein [Bacteroidales bacterium]